MLIRIIQIDRSDLEVYIISDKFIINSIYQHSVQSVQVAPTLIPLCDLLFRIEINSQWGKVFGDHWTVPPEVMSTYVYNMDKAAKRLEESDGSDEGSSDR